MQLEVQKTYLWYWQIVCYVVLGVGRVAPHPAPPADLAGLVGGDAHVALGAPAPAGRVAASTRK